jgi:RNA polymerase subunit RPABC4/transcription elongation factor Spt4
MSFIVCRSCKKFVEVDETLPLNFDKCDNCGHTLEFAVNDMELKMILNNLTIPDVSYNKICASCHSLNPRETGACLHCGSTNLQLQYDLDSISNFNGFGTDGKNGLDNTQTIIIQTRPAVSPRNSLLFRLFSLMIGLVDFFFFSLIGIQIILGSSELPSNVMAFATQNMYQLTAVISLSLILAGIMSVMIIPRMSYKDSIEMSSSIGVVVGLVTLIASKDLLIVIMSIILCSILSGIGGLIGEFIIHKLTGRSKD